MAAPPLNAARNIIFSLVGPCLRFADILAMCLVYRQWRICIRSIGVDAPSFPWLMLPPLATRRHSPPALLRSFYDIPGGRAYEHEVPAYHRCVATGGGWLVLAAVDTLRRIVLANPITGAMKVLPWPFGEKPSASEGIRAVLTCSPAYPSCFLAVATDRLIAFCRPGRCGGGWSTLDVLGYRHGGACSYMVAVGSTVYLVDERRKLWRSELAAPEPKVERRDTAFALQQQGDSRWSNYLVESFGNVHLVVSDQCHKHVSLYQLDWQARIWLRKAVSVLGHRVLLLGHGCSTAVPASTATGHASGAVLFARQTLDPLLVGSTVWDQQWFWSESRLDAGVDDMIVLKKTVSHWPDAFTVGDSFWFFLSIDRGQ